ncbi:MAG: GGDEF domain-containing protein [Alphaproteobacteria bacterium]|nr:GGDEF domain-containing protein [Alphaproteobacteria bacterium]
MRAFSENKSMPFSSTEKVRWGVFAPMPSDQQSHQDDEDRSQKAELRRAMAIIHAQEAKIRTLEALAITDLLTGLLNRRGFFSAFERELALVKRDTDNEGVLMMLHLDGLKAVNETWGPRMGDAYLRAAAKTLRASVRASDIVARVGGDKFAVLLTRINEKTAAARCEKIERSFGRVRVLPEKLLLRASFASASYQGSSRMDDVFQVADLKLCEAKTEKRGFIVVGEDD